MTHDAQIRFLDNLDAAIKFHSESDPHGISNAVITSLAETRSAFAKACHLESYTKVLTPPTGKP